MLRRFCFRLGGWLVGLSGQKAANPTEVAAYHLDVENRAQGFSPETRQQLKWAAEDFEAAQRGLEPIHARLETAMLDGGTTLWRGDGYSITLMKSLTTVGEIHGLMFGPVLKLEYPLAHGNTTEISQVVFYTPAALNQLLGKG